MAKPTVTVEDQTILLGSTSELANLFTANDPDGDPITRIRVRDNNNNIDSGYLTFNGVVQPPNTVLIYDWADLDKLVYRSGTAISVEQLDISVEAGGQWSDFSSFLMYSVVENVNRPDLVFTDLTTVQNEFSRVADTVSYSDPDGWPVTRWKVRDRNPGPYSGYLQLNGEILAPMEWHYVEVEDFGNLRFYAGFSAPNLDVLDIRARDGANWSWLTTANSFTTLNFNRPVVVPSEYLIATDERVALEDLFSVTDADNNTIKQYRFWDATPHAWSGNMLLDGLPIGANQWFQIDSADLGRMEWESASRNFNEEIRIQAFDGTHWSTIQNIRVATNEKPVIGVGRNYSIRQQLEFVDLSELVQKLDDGPAYISYEVYDSNTDVLSGGFRQGQQVLTPGQVHTLTPQEFFSLDFKSGVYEQRSVDEVYVRANNGTFWSDWTRHTIRTEPEYTDSLAASSWLNFLTQQNGQLTLTYSFMQDYPDYETGDAPEAEFVQPWFEMRQLVRQAFVRMSEVVNIHFEEVPDSINTETGRGGIIRMGTYCLDHPAAAYAFFPADPLTNPEGGDMWFNRLFMGGPTLPNEDPCVAAPIPFDAWDRGDPNHSTFIHEFGHALGLKHPFDPTPVLPPATDWEAFSVMSYSGHFDSGPGEDVLVARSPMLYDVAALQSIYGANQTHNMGDTVYDSSHFRGSFQNILDAIWDTGGTDIIDASDQINPVSLDLRPGGFQSILRPQQLAIAFEVDIENASGGSASDVIIGNDLANVLTANGGDDLIQGYGGDDLLHGMGGNDVYVYQMNDGRDVINELSGAGRDRLQIGEFLGLDVFTEDLSFTREGNDLIIDFSIDEGVSRGEVRIVNQPWGRYRVETLEVLGQDIDLPFLYSQLTTPGQQFAVTSDVGTYGLLVAPA